MLKAIKKRKIKKRMKKLACLLLATIAAIMVFTSCSDSETYADQKKRERNAINAYIKEHGINVISEEDFEAQNETTDTTKHEYVYLDNSGVYLQIIRKGCGKN